MPSRRRYGVIRFEDEKNGCGSGIVAFLDPRFFGEFILQASSDHSSSRVGSHRVQSLSLLLLFAGGAGLTGCSKADTSQGEWPDPGVTQPQESTEPEGLPSGEQGPDQDSGSESEPEPSGEDSKDKEPDATTPEPDEDSPESSTSGDGSQDESKDSTTQDPSGGDTDEPGDTTSTQTSSSSTSTDETKSSSASSSEDSSSSSTQDTGQDTGQDSSDDGGEPEACEPELCVRMNDTQPSVNRPWRVGVNMFSFQVPKTHRRLARIELFEGFGTGQTRATLRLDAGTSSATVIGWLQWSVNLPSSQAWLGANLSEPFSMESHDKLWVVIGELPASRRASIASSGISYSIWHKASGSQSWTESSAPLMFRAYCCKE